LGLFYIFYFGLTQKIYSFFPLILLIYWIPSNGFELEWIDLTPVRLVVTIGAEVVLVFNTNELLNELLNELSHDVWYDVPVLCVATVLFGIIGMWKDKLEDWIGEAPRDNGLISLVGVPKGLP